MDYKTNLEGTSIYFENWSSQLEEDLTDFLKENVTTGELVIGIRLGNRMYFFGKNNFWGKGIKKLASVGPIKKSVRTEIGDEFNVVLKFRSLRDICRERYDPENNANKFYIFYKQRSNKTYKSSKSVFLITSL